MSKTSYNTFIYSTNTNTKVKGENPLKQCYNANNNTIYKEPEVRTMIIKEISVEAKKSKNYQTYTVSLTATVNREEDIAYDPTMDIVRLQGKAREMTEKQLTIDQEKTRT